MKKMPTGKEKNTCKLEIVPYFEIHDQAVETQKKIQLTRAIEENGPIPVLF